MAGDPFGTAVLATPAQNLQPDAARLAKAKGWTVDQALARQHPADAVGANATPLAATYPDAFVGSALPQTPGGAPTLYLKGPANAFARAMVAAADMEVAVADGQPYSVAELIAVVLQVAY